MKMTNSVHVQKILLSIWGISLIGFLILTGLVIRDSLRSTDFAFTVKLQDRIPERFDPKFVTIVDLGSMEIQTTLIVIALILAPVSKKMKLLLAGAYVAGLVVTLMGKSFLPQPAPAFLLQRGTSGIAFPSSHVQVDASYPSGHTYRVMYLAAVAIGTYLISKKQTLYHATLAILAIILAALVMTGLVLLGKHWVTDVLGGLFLASGLVSACLYSSSFSRRLSLSR